MPTQAPAAAAVPVVHAPDGCGYRLLELPDGFDVNARWSLVADDAGLARLCSSTPGGGGPSYSLRQKNTSNALVLLAADNAPADGAAPRLAAVATLHETVELVEEKRPAPTDAAGTAAAAAAAPKAAPPPRGRWHEKFGRTR